MKRFLFLAALASPAVLAQAQSPRVVVLDVLVENIVSYKADMPDPGTSGTDVGPVATSLRAFQEFIGIGDIVSVNGKPAKGVWTNWGYTLSRTQSLNPNPAPGEAIANVALATAGHVECTWELYTADGVFVGRLLGLVMNARAVCGRAWSKREARSGVKWSGVDGTHCKNGPCRSCSFPAG